MAVDTYKAVARLKLDSNEYIERGETVEDPSDEAIASGTVVTERQFDQLFPDFSKDVEEGANQAAGTPSNMEQVEGTDLAAESDKKDEGENKSESDDNK